jgi:hypothetical protein
MSRRDYVTFAEIIGRSLAAAYMAGGENARTLVYNELYAPTVAYFAEGNPAFDQLKFAHAVAEREHAHGPLALLRAQGVGKPSIVEQR